MSQFFQTKEETEAWLKKMGVENCSIRDDLIVDVNGNVSLNGRRLTAFRVRFGNVSGSFWCHNNQLTSLAGAPSSVGKSFECHCNQLTSLAGAPSSVGSAFSCNDNRLTSLAGAPSTVPGDFFCSDNQLLTLKGGPLSVGDGFYCRENDFTSLAGAPLVAGNFESDFSPAKLREQIRALFAEGRAFSAGNLTALCAEIRAEMAAEAMSSAIGDESSGPAATRRKAGRA